MYATATKRTKESLAMPRENHLLEMERPSKRKSVRFAASDKLYIVDEDGYSEQELAACFWTMNELLSISEYPQFLSEQRFLNDSDRQRDHQATFCSRGFLTPNECERRYQSRQDIAEAVLTEQAVQHQGHYSDDALLAEASEKVSRRHAGEALRRARLWYTQEQTESTVTTSGAKGSSGGTLKLLRGGSRARFIAKSRTGGNRLFDDLRTSPRAVDGISLF
jgi:hypothetical protein